LIATPDRKEGSRSSALVELLDLYPTLADLCGLPAPPDVEGVSLVPVLKNPSAAVKKAALTQHPRPAYYNRERSKSPQAMGYSIRTDRFRYTEWRDWQSGVTVARELYDHESDPDETRNIVEAAAHANDARQCAAILKSFQLLARPH
jgi:iduronate 2-sulfatase